MVSNCFGNISSPCVALYLTCAFFKKFHDFCFLKFFPHINKDYAKMLTYFIHVLGLFSINASFLTFLEYFYILSKLGQMTLCSYLDLCINLFFWKISTLWAYIDRYAYGLGLLLKSRWTENLENGGLPALWIWFAVKFEFYLNSQANGVLLIWSLFTSKFLWYFIMFKGLHEVVETAHF